MPEELALSNADDLIAAAGSCASGGRAVQRESRIKSPRNLAPAFMITVRLARSGGPGGGLTWNWGFDDDAQAAGANCPRRPRRHSYLANAKPSQQPLLGGE